MYSIETVKHHDANISILGRAIAMKQVAWPYPKDSQLTWMQNNLQPDDVHVFLQEGGQDVAYLNIARVTAIINGGGTKCAGIGNVCTRQLGGYSKLLITNIVH